MGLAFFVLKEISDSEQSPLQENLHVPTTAGDPQHMDVSADRPADDAVGLEENFAVLPDPHCERFLGVSAAPGGCGKAGEEGFLHPSQDAIRPFRRVALGDMIVKFGEVLRRAHRSCRG